MLSRHADSLYWLSRYVERAENAARLIDTAQRFSVMPAGYAGATNEWESALAATGALAAYSAQHEKVTPQEAVHFLALSPANPSSIRNCFENARANARAVRTALTGEMWESINGAYLELRRFSSLSRQETGPFVAWVKDAVLRIDGAAYRGMLRNDVYYFSRLGVHVERADATARILDVKYHLLLPAQQAVGGSVDYYQWLSILRAVSAATSYHWVYREGLKPRLVADLLILRPEMPRSLANCYDVINDMLDRLAKAYGRQGAAQRLARATRTRLANAEIGTIFAGGLHEFLTGFIAENRQLAEAIARQYLA